MEMIKRGEIYFADLSPVIGSEQGGVRPVLVVQNNVGNKYSPTIIAAAITSQLEKAKLPTHIQLPAEKFGLPRESVNTFKQTKIKQVATQYLLFHKMLNASVRFDVIDILRGKLTHITNAF